WLINPAIRITDPKTEHLMAILRIFARFAYVPTLAIGLNIVAVWLVSRGFSYAWTGLLFAVAIGLSLLMEGVLPYEAAWNYSHAFGGSTRSIMACSGSTASMV